MENPPAGCMSGAHQVQHVLQLRVCCLQGLVDIRVCGDVVVRCGVRTVHYEGLGRSTPVTLSKDHFGCCSSAFAVVCVTPGGCLQRLIPDPLDPLQTFGGMDAECPLVDRKVTASPTPSASFFFLGIGGAITFYTIITSVAYFKDTLGEGAFGSLLLAHFGGSLTAMILLLVVAGHISTRLHSGLVAAGLLYKLCFNTTLFVHVALGTPITALRMHVMVGLNGLAMGTCKSSTAALTRVFNEYSYTKSASGAQLLGAGFASMVPTLLQLAMLQTVAPDQSYTEIQAKAAYAAMVTACTAGCLVAAALAALLRIRTHPAATATDPLPRTESECPVALTEPAADSIGQCLRGGRALRQFVQGRLQRVGLCSAGQLLVNGCVVHVAAMAPLVPSQAAANPNFWRVFLPTVIIATVNICGFVSRLGVLAAPERLRVVAGAPAALLGLVAADVAAAAAVHKYLRGPPDWAAGSDLGIVGVYGLAAVATGVSAVALADKAQRVCAHSIEAVCPVVAQLTWLGIEVGAVVGLGLTKVIGPG